MHNEISTPPFPPAHIIVSYNSIRSRSCRNIRRHTIHDSLKIHLPSLSHELLSTLPVLSHCCLHGSKFRFPLFSNFSSSSFHGAFSTVSHFVFIFQREIFWVETKETLHAKRRALGMTLNSVSLSSIISK